MRIERLAKVVFVVLTTSAVLIKAETHHGEFDIRGLVVKITKSPRREAGAVVRTIVVDGHAPDSQKLKAVVRVTEATKVFAKKKGQLREVGFRALRAGLKVEIKLSGPVRESYPIQATAAEVLILE